jgi:hypothetical protein
MKAVKFKAEKAKDIKEFRGAKSGTLEPSEEAEKILGKVDFGILFAYLFRRFGYPNYGTDSYKSIASYYLTTPMEDVYLWCDPRPCECSMFGYVYTRDLELKVYEEYFKKDYEALEDESSVTYHIKEALNVAIQDLLTPTSVRDVGFNIKGKCANSGIVSSQPKAL